MKDKTFEERRNRIADKDFWTGISFNRCQRVKQLEKLAFEEGERKTRDDIAERILEWERNHDLSENSADNIICEILSIVREGK